MLGPVPGRPQPCRLLGERRRGGQVAVAAALPQGPRQVGRGDGREIGVLAVRGAVEFDRARQRRDDPGRGVTRVDPGHQGTFAQPEQVRVRRGQARVEEPREAVPVPRPLADPQPGRVQHHRGAGEQQDGRVTRGEPRAARLALLPAAWLRLLHRGERRGRPVSVRSASDTAVLSRPTANRLARCWSAGERRPRTFSASAAPRSRAAAALACSSAANAVSGVTRSPPQAARTGRRSSSAAAWPALA